MTTAASAYRNLVRVAKNGVWGFGEVVLVT